MNLTRRRFGFCSLGVASAFALAAAAPSQAALGLRTAGAVDSYTLGDPAAMEQAGCVSFGPFAFGDNHDNAMVANLLPDEPLLWLETAHFRIGAALAPLAVPEKDKAATTSLRAELQRLAQRLPGVRPDTNKLDPWLRVHLVAQRAEDVHAAICRQLGVTDTDFPPAPGNDPRDARTFRGIGPHFGMPEKFTILLVQKPTSLARYTAAFHGDATEKPTRFHDHKFGCAFFGAAEQGGGGLLQNDLALRAHLTYHTAHNLLTSYRSFSHQLPAWLINGLAWWHCRQASTRHPAFDLREGLYRDPSRYLLWDRLRTSQLANGDLQPLDRFLERMDLASFSMDDHLQSWALVDFLLATRADELARFVERMKDPFHARCRFPTQDELFGRQHEALREAFGTDATGLEAMWKRHAGVKIARR
jgi:hypothetical protein